MRLALAFLLFLVSVAKADETLREVVVRGTLRDTQDGYVIDDEYAKQKWFVVFYDKISDADIAKLKRQVDKPFRIVGHPGKRGKSKVIFVK